MAIGIPIVTTDAGGLPDLIQDGVDGILVPVNDLAGFVLKIEELLQDQEKAKSLARAGRCKAEQFSWENVREQWTQVIENVV